MSRRKSKATRHPGLAPGCFRKVRREFVDQDYAEDLPEDAKKFLSDFNEGYYNARFKYDDNELDWTPEQKKAAYRANYVANQDWYAIGKVSGRGHSVEDLGLRGIRGFQDYDDSTTPAFDLSDDYQDRDWENYSTEYLEHPEYRKALARYRDAMASRGKPQSDDFQQAEKDLEAVVRLGKLGLL